MIENSISSACCQQLIVVQMTMMPFVVPHSIQVIAENERELPSTSRTSKFVMSIYLLVAVINENIMPNTDKNSVLSSAFIDDEMRDPNWNANLSVNNLLRRVHSW
ncbi:uncharacterized protein LOC135483434 isoform X2 [Lineus longissimus]|uniref:uncharacterized protein LOC135483434 isoform X2 n=1 Tax=Lineus longissimus TaxID=88925 RepID=UPI002B4CD78F